MKPKYRPTVNILRSDIIRVIEHLSWIADNPGEDANNHFMQELSELETRLEQALTQDKKAAGGKG